MVFGLRLPCPDAALPARFRGERRDALPTLGLRSLPTPPLPRRGGRETLRMETERKGKGKRESEMKKPGRGEGRGGA